MVTRVSSERHLFLLMNGHSGGSHYLFASPLRLLGLVYHRILSRAAVPARTSPAGTCRSQCTTICVRTFAAWPPHKSQLPLHCLLCSSSRPHGVPTGLGCRSGDAGAADPPVAPPPSAGERGIDGSTSPQTHLCQASSPARAASAERWWASQADLTSSRSEMASPMPWRRSGSTGSSHNDRSGGAPASPGTPLA